MYDINTYATLFGEGVGLNVGLYARVTRKGAICSSVSVLFFVHSTTVQWVLYSFVATRTF